ncbi:type I methionyl aminopeptidase [Salinispira pacifica]|uniref:Methionine aminopeptidase n=1 Tax=Salinispira pacifica TaxID=1307761 RepID=V5WI59_9SPIO|nr:type I methionyl aminopeptidase [Salinispira pacifica]AHC15234.1 Methionine aminopeptidase [Salinispira pacifica]
MIKIKNQEQIEGIRVSCRLLADLFDVLETEVKPGISPAELDRLARTFISDNGGTPAFLGYGGFPAALCTSVNSQVIHGIPNEKPLAEGDVISIDCGINLNGYISDSAYTFPVGAVSEEVAALLKTTEESLYKGIDAAVYGNRVKDISRAVYKHCKPKGYGIVREYSGHGVGLEVHEEPSVPNYPGGGPNPRLKPGMVLAIEPMINLGGDSVYVQDDDWTVETRDRSISAHFEHTVAIYEDHTEILTLRKRNP